MSRFIISAVIGGIALATSPSVHAIGSPQRSAIVSRDGGARSENPAKPLVGHDSNVVSTLRINGIRLAPPPPDAPNPSLVLKFAMLNSGILRISDVVIEIAILTRPPAQDRISDRRIIAGPFTINGHATIEAGYTVDYELLLRNLSPDCDCVAQVNVLSARPAPDSAQ